MRARRPTAALTALVLLLAGCHSQNAAAPSPTSPLITPSITVSPTSSPTTVSAVPEPTPPELDRFYAQRAHWAACAKPFGAVDDADLTGLQCATILVPIDYRHPTGRTITLSMVRLPTSAKTKIGSLLIDPGGPGESGLEYAQWETGLPAMVRARFDLVWFDPRGVGASAGLHCLPTAQLDRALDLSLPSGLAGAKASAAADARLRDGCQRTAGWELPYLGTANAARDMDVIRSAVGDAATTYLGYSYGTELGAVYAQEFPYRVRALVLDGARPPGQTQKDISHSQAIYFDRELLVFLADCIKQGTCPWKGTPQAARAEVEALLSRIEQEPLATSLGRPLREEAALDGLVAGLYFPTSWHDLAAALGQAEDGDGTGLLALADQTHDREGGRYLSELSAITAISCADKNESMTPAATVSYQNQWRREAPVFGAYFTLDLLVCAGWPTSAAPEPTQVSAKGAAPIVVVGNTGDPVTPYAGSEALAAQLDSGRLLTFVGEGHTAYGSGRSSCVDDAVNAYLVDLVVPATGQRCS